MGQRGRYLEMRRADVPVKVSVMIRLASLVVAASTTALATDSFESIGILTLIFRSAARVL